jgi:hypothetical protein
MVNGYFLAVIVLGLAACATMDSAVRRPDEVDQAGLSPAMDARLALARAEQLQRRGQPAASVEVLEDLLHSSSIGGQLSDTGRAMIYAMLADGYRESRDAVREREALGDFVLAGALLPGDDMRTRVRSARATLLASDVRSGRIGATPNHAVLVDDISDVDSILAMLSCEVLPAMDEDPYPEATPPRMRLERRQLRCQHGRRLTLWFSLDG